MDAAGFESFYVVALPKAVRIAEAVVGWGSGTADDIAQESFIKLLRRWDEFSDWSSGRRMAWLGTVVRNAAIDVVRHDSRSVAQAPEAWNQVPDEASLSGEVVDELYVEGLVALLPDRQQQAIRCHYLEGRSQEECASRLGMRYGSFRNLLVSARKMLAELSGVEAEATDGDVTAKG